MTSPHDYSHVDDFFGGGGKSLSFDPDKGYQLGQWKGGVILTIRPKQQQTDMQSRKPLFWDDAQQDPKWTLPVELGTDERDPQTPHDDGRRTLWVSGGIERAVRDHLRSTNARLRPGGTIYVAWVGGAGKIGDPKQYQVAYTPAAHTAADQMLTAPQAQPQQPAQPQQWAGAQAAPAAQPQQQWGALSPPAAPQWQPNPAATPAPQAGLWNGQPAAGPPPTAAPQAAPAPAPLAAAPAGPPPAPIAPQAAPQPVMVDAAAIDAAYGHLSPDQRAAIVASGMSPQQVAGIYGPPQGRGRVIGGELELDDLTAEMVAWFIEPEGEDEYDLLAFDERFAELREAWAWTALRAKRDGSTLVVTAEIQRDGKAALTKRFEVSVRELPPGTA